jgi:methionine synthase II (cobalamin-independent)
VKQALPGPYTLGRRLAAGSELHERSSATHRAAAELRALVAELAHAGCPLIEIEEVDAHLIGDDERERERFRSAHRWLANGIDGTHLSLSISGSSAWGAGLETITEAAYASLAVDLIAGPDNWNLVTRLPGDRGVIAGALPGRDSPADTKETLLWAARYAAATRGRGLDRVGLGSAGSWANLTWEAAVAKTERLGEAARLAAMPAGPALARRLDPRAVNARTAAMGHDPAAGHDPKAD